MDGTADGIAPAPRVIMRADAAAIIEQASDAYVGMDAGGIVIGWNRRAEALFGWSASEAIGNELAILIIPPRLRDRHRAGFRSYAKSGRSDLIGRRLEVPALHRTGVEFPVELSMSAVMVDREVTFHAFIVDATARIRREQFTLAHLRVANDLANVDRVPPQQVVERILTTIGEVLDWDYVNFWCRRGPEAPIECHVHWARVGFDTEAFDIACGTTSFQPGAGDLGFAWAERSAHWISDLTHRRAYVRGKVAAQAGFRTCVIVPSVVRGGSVALIEALHRQRRPRDDELLVVMGSIGAQLGQFVSHVALEREVRDLQALEINDDIVQQLAIAQLALDIGRRETARRAIDNALAAARSLITSIVSAAGPPEPGRFELLSEQDPWPPTDSKVPAPPDGAPLAS